MGLFDFFKKNQIEQNSSTPINGFKQNAPIEIPKDIFIEEREPLEQQPVYRNSEEAKGIDAIYAFLQADYESKGYSDALTNPDDSYKTDNIKLIKLDLQILIQQVNTYYEDLIREIDFHINSRSRAGLVDLVEELKTRKEMIVEHMGKVEEVKKEMERDSGMTQRIILSYQRGFMKGLSALTQSNVLTKKL